MKIAINTRFLLKDKLEGIGWFSHEIIRRIVNQHPEDEFLFLFDRPYHADFIYAKNVEAVIINPPARHPLLWYTWFESAVPRVLKKWQPDVFFSPDGYCSLKSSTKTLMVTHDLAHLHFPEQVPYLARKYYQRYVPQYLNRADKVVAVSEFTKQDIIKNYSLPTDKVKVVYNACRTDFKPLPEGAQQKIRDQYSNGFPYFFYLGAVHPRKNVHRLIEAFDQFKQQTNAPHQLLIGGRFAWQTGPVKTAYDNAQRQQDIVFLDYLDNTATPKLMAAAFAFVYPSLFEGFGIPVLEAMHTDTPVITSNVSSLPEVAGDAALLVNPMVSKEIEKAMLQLYNEMDLRQTLIQNGRVQRQQFDWDKSAARIYNLLSKL